MIYLDSSVVVASVVGERRTEDVNRYIDGGGDWVLSELVVAEVSAALSSKTRTGDLTRSIATERLSYLDRWRVLETVEIEITPADLRAATELVRRYGLKLRAPDAIHIVLVRRIGATLATLDLGMADAAEALGLRVERLSA